MKTLFIKPTLFLLTTCQSIFGQATKTDTTFIRKDSLKGFSQSIFYETDKNSKFYERITSFKFGEFDKESYDSSLEYLKTNKINQRKRKAVLPSTGWVTLKQYNGQFYAYHPCDFFNYFKVSINDTTFVEWAGEGPIGTRIRSQKKLNDTTFEIKFSRIYEGNRTVIIHIIDKIKGIAVFSDTTENGVSNYLMIMANKIKSVPFIVNNCETHKQPELNFEEPDFEKLLKRRL